MKKGIVDHDLAARVWLVLALAGEADNQSLAAHAQRVLAENHSPEAYCNVALACRFAGLCELGERLHAAAHSWQPTNAEDLALKLKTQLAFGASFKDCKETAHNLLSQRSGDRWDNTKATSWAIEALSQMFVYIPDRTPVKHVKVLVADKPVLDITDPAELKKLVYRVHLSAVGQAFQPATSRQAGKPALPLPTVEGLEIALSGECDEPIHYAIRAIGTQRMDKLEPEGTRIKMQRRLETLDGKPFKGPLAVGQVIAVRLSVDLQENEQYLIVEDRRPAGCEFVGERITGKDAGSSAHVEFRDDRLCAFYTSLPAGHYEIVYYLRAETPGISNLLPGCAYPMYAEKVRGETGSSRVEIQAQK